ncbi:J-domain-containing protein [Streptomyces sp. 8N114]|uniref:J-domain-containing protein n=1 Tax=Streptomyces sp. 8N114 TaxID=3457419 RepID=UPI003FD3D583
MTERKPPGVSFESWADRQIREAEERGEFADLPGAGKPLPGLDKPYTEQWWVERKMRDENLSYLPPSLALRKEAQEARDRAAKARSEAEVHSILTEINAKIDEAIRHPLEGPPHRLVPFDVESAVRQWRSARRERG